MYIICGFFSFFGSDLSVGIASRFKVKKPLEVRESLKLSHLTFVKPVQVLQITHAGIKYQDDKLGLCVIFPEGAIPKNCKLCLEVGMSLFGPFKFPMNTTPISPILMLCPQEDISLQKPFSVTLPHIIDKATEGDVEAMGIGVVKANHTAEAYLGTQKQFSFEDTDSKVVFEQIRQFEDENSKEYATFSLTHFCFISLRINESMKLEVRKRKSFCIGPFYPTRISVTTPVLTFHFPITYYMDPWLEVCIN